MCLQGLEKAVEKNATHLSALQASLDQLTAHVLIIHDHVVVGRRRSLTQLSKPPDLMPSFSEGSARSILSSDTGSPHSPGTPTKGSLQSPRQTGGRPSTSASMRSRAKGRTWARQRSSAASPVPRTPQTTIRYVLRFTATMGPNTQKAMTATCRREQRVSRWRTTEGLLAVNISQTFHILCCQVHACRGIASQCAYHTVLSTVYYGDELDPSPQGKKEVDLDVAIRHARRMSLISSLMPLPAASRWEPQHFRAQLTQCVG